MKRSIVLPLLLCCCPWNYGIAITQNHTWCDNRQPNDSDVEVASRLRDRSWCQPRKKSCVRLVEHDIRCSHNRAEECKSGVDECFCDESLKELHFDMTLKSNKCFRCLSNKDKVIALPKTCDGIVDCPDLSDECLCTRTSGLTNLCENIDWGTETTTSKEFRCDLRTSLHNLTLKQICDGTADCINGIDEKHCRIQGSLIKEASKPLDCRANPTNKRELFLSKLGLLGRYYWWQECDLVLDCQSGSDECQDKCFEDKIFSDKISLVSMKKSGYLMSISGVISTVAVIGNSIAIVLTCWKLRHKRRMSKGEILTKTLFLSLSISDSLVAIYTTVIWSKANSKELGSEYCKYDNIWRSSVQCSILGCLFTIGSEQSVFTLVLITLSRVLAIRRPFASPPVRAISGALVVCWVFSILFATIPLIPQLEDVFLLRVLSPNDNDVILRSIDSWEIEKLSYLLLMGSKNNSFGQSAGQIGSWSRLRYLMKNKLNMSVTEASHFGYYSVHSVCLPTLFPYQKDRAWLYSLFMLLINFLAFVFMVLGYLIIYRERRITENSVGVGPQRGKPVSFKIKVKIVLILATDLLCWLPVCVMGFVNCAGHKINTNVYPVAAFVILPINSAVNPFVYTVSSKYLRSMIRQNMPCPRNRPKGEPETVELRTLT